MSQNWPQQNVTFVIDTTCQLRFFCDGTESSLPVKDSRELVMLECVEGQFCGFEQRGT
jgi:hypothetical protein